MTPPSRPRHHRRLARLVAAARALAAAGRAEVRGAELCRAAGLEGPHRDAALEAAVRAGLLAACRTLPPPTRPSAARYTLPPHTP